MTATRKEKLKELLVSVCPRCEFIQARVDACYCSECGLNLEDKQFLTKYCPSCGSMDITYRGAAVDEKERDYCMWICHVCESRFWVSAKFYVHRQDRIIS